MLSKLSLYDLASSLQHNKHRCISGLPVPIFRFFPALLQLGAFEPRSPPREPVYDSHEWINSHYPRYGYAARSPLYSWRDWAAAALPRHDLEAYLATEQLMADDERRGGLVKQAQWVSLQWVERHDTSPWASRGLQLLVSRCRGCCAQLLCMPQCCGVLRGSFAQYAQTLEVPLSCADSLYSAHDTNLGSQELARLWDWQKRRAKLGLPPDLPPDSTSAPSSSSGFDSSSSHSSTPSDSSSSSGVGGTASGRGTASGLKADAVSPGQQDHLPVEAAAGPDEAKTTEEGGGTGG